VGEWFCVGGLSDVGGWGVLSLGHVCVGLGHGQLLVVMFGLFVHRELRIVREGGGGVDIWLWGMIEFCHLSSLCINLEWGHLFLHSGYWEIWCLCHIMWLLQ